VAEADAVRGLVALTGQYASVDEDLTGRENLVLLARPLGLEARRAGRAERLPLTGSQRRLPRGLVAVSLVTSGVGLLYAVYRGYYGLGGTAGMIGRPASWAEFRLINLVAATVLLVVALLPVAALPLWRHPRLRRLLLALCWVLADGLVMHALIDDTQRVLDMTGIVRMHRGVHLLRGRGRAGHAPAESPHLGPPRLHAGGGGVRERLRAGIGGRAYLLLARGAQSLLLPDPAAHRPQG
jgi:hypothetical protein